MLRLEATQSGQMAPVPKVWTFDQKTADAAECAKLKSLLDSCGFFDAAEPKSGPAPDRGMISILVESGDRSRRLTLPLGAIPTNLKPLIEFIEPRLSWKPRKP